MKLAISFFLFFLILTACLTIYFYNWSTRPPRDFKPQTIRLEQEESLRSFSNKIKSSGLIDSDVYFRLLLRVGPYSYRAFQAGKYTFHEPVSPSELMETITEGLVDHELAVQITVPEGFSLPQIIERAASYGLNRQSLESLAYDEKFVHSLGVQAKTIEGFVAPATYRFYDNIPSAKKFYKRAVKVFFKRLPSDYKESLKSLEISLEEAVNIASLIEKETSFEEERPFVSEVIWRRLKGKIPLGIDAALIYGIKNYQGDIKTSHLRDRKNKYNTRIHRGLPPTPIGSPSVGSLKAVLTPSNEGYLYYVLKPGKNQKTHYFSKTLREHNKQVRKLVKGGG